MFFELMAKINDQKRVLSMNKEKLDIQEFRV